MYDYEVPIDEYDLHGAEGGLLQSLGGALKGAVTGFITGGPGGAIAGAGLGALSTLGGAEQQEMVSAGLVPGVVAPTTFTGCGPGMVRDQSGICVAIGSPGDLSTGVSVVPGVAGGTPVAGRYGMALAPQVTSQLRHRCPRGMVLGTDNLCYEKLSKKQRKWTPGRKPLFTGGDLNAITRAGQLRDKAKKIAQDLGYNVRTKEAAARSSGRARRGRGKKQLPPPTLEAVVIDTD